MNSCITPEQIQRFMAEQLSEAERETMETHLSECIPCLEALERLSQADPILDSLISLAGRMATRAEPLEPFLKQLQDNPPPEVLGSTEPGDSGGATEFHFLDPPTDDLGPLGRLDSYHIVELLGCGGYGFVFKAYDEMLNSLVALKVLKPEQAAGASERDQFLGDAQKARAIQDEHVVTIHNVGSTRASRLPYFVMEYLDGGSLSDRLKQQGPLKPEEAAEFVRQAALGLVAVHARGLIHRDIKPSNIMLEKSSGRVKITDFGLARWHDVSAETLTQSGGIVGTLPYISPEMIRSASRIDKRSDVYSLGVVLYELLTGERPFRGQPQMILEQVVHDEPRPPRRLNDAIPYDLETIALVCLAKEPNRRCQSASEVADAIQRWQERKPSKIRRTGAVERLWLWCRRKPALAAATALAAAALLAVSVVTTLWAVREGRHAAILQVALDEAKYRRAENHFDRGLALCDRDDVGFGLLWLARALERAPAGADDLKSIIRTQIAGWARRVIPLKACLDSPEPVTASALSPDGRTVWAAGRDQCLRRWDVTRRELLGPPTRLPARVTAIAWGPRGKVLTVCNDGTAQLWDAEKGSQVGPPLPHKVTSAAWDPRGRCLVTGGADGSVRLWDADGGASGKPGFRQNLEVSVLTVSPDGKTVLTGDGKNARLWDAVTGLAAGGALQHQDDVLAAAFSPDGRTILTSSGDRTTQLWEAATGKPVGGPLLHKSRVGVLAFSPDGRAFVTGGHDGMARVWTLETKHAVGQPLRHESEVRAMAFSSDGRTLLTAGFGNILRIWEIAFDRPMGQLLTHGVYVKAVGFLPQGGTIFTAGNGAVRFWDSATGGAVGEPLTTSNEPIMGVTLSHDGRQLLARCWSLRAWLWDTGAPGQAGMHFDHPIEARWVNSAALSPDSSIVLTGCSDGSVRFWDSLTAAPWRGDFDHRGPVYAAAFSPDGKTAATGGDDGKVCLWDVASRKALGEPLMHDGPVLSLAFNPRGDKLLTASADHRARLWDVSSGALLLPELRHGGGVRIGAFSPEGRRILTTSEDGTARLWDAGSGKPLGEPLVHNDYVVAAAFSPDGKTVLTGSEDGTARLWDVATGKSLGPPLAHASSVEAVAFSPDGKAVLTGSADGTARLWVVLPPAAESPDAIARELEALTGLRLDEMDTLRLLDAAAWEERLQLSVSADSLLPPRYSRD
jgi:WD40 repeat protein